jgi:low affinity Fe/Cu permease
VQRLSEWFGTLAGKVSQAAGSVWAFTGAALLIVVWAATGPVFGFSEVWQLVINTGTTIITFLMVFIIQHAQNKDMRAVQLKLNELIAAVEGASNRLIDVEDLSDHEVERLYERYQRLASTAQKLSRGAKLSIEAQEKLHRDGTAKGADERQAKRRVPVKSEAAERKRPRH